MGQSIGVAESGDEKGAGCLKLRFNAGERRRKVLTFRPLHIGSPPQSQQINNV